MAPAKKASAASEPLAGLVVATDSYAAEVDGASITVVKGQVLRKDDPRAVSGLVRPASESDLIEQATAAPGEHRSVSW